MSTIWLQFSEEISVVHRQLEEDPPASIPIWILTRVTAIAARFEELAIGAALTELEVARAAVALAAARPACRAARHHNNRCNQSQDLGRARRRRAIPAGNLIPVSSSLCPPTATWVTIWSAWDGANSKRSLAIVPRPAGRCGVGCSNTPRWYTWARSAGCCIAGAAAWAWLCVGGPGHMARYGRSRPAGRSAGDHDRRDLDRPRAPHVLPPRTLPKLAFTEGIPVACSSLVVIPGLISSYGGRGRSVRPVGTALPAQPRPCAALCPAHRL